MTRICARSSIDGGLPKSSRKRTTMIAAVLGLAARAHS
jgi:hypothetical protein